MANYVRLINSTESVNAKIACYNIPYNWNNQTSPVPIPGNFSNIQPVQFNGWENPAIVLNFNLYLDNNPSGFLTWAEWMKLVKSQSPTLLTIVVGATDTSITSYANSTIGTTSIPIQIVSFDTNFDPNNDADVGMINISARCLETSV